MRAPIPSNAIDAGCSVRLDFSGCISLRTALRDVPSVVQSWGATENIRLLSVTLAISFLWFFLLCFKHVILENSVSLWQMNGTESTD